MQWSEVKPFGKQDINWGILVEKHLSTLPCPNCHWPIEVNRKLLLQRKTVKCHDCGCLISYQALLDMNILRLENEREQVAA